MILPPNHLALKGYLRPPVMAIGDSMFNARFRWNILDGTMVVEIDEGRLTCR